MKNIEKRLLAYYKEQTENAPVASKTQRTAPAIVRKPWGKIAKIAVAAVLVIAILAALPLFKKEDDTNGTDVLMNDNSNEKSEVENTETTSENDNSREESEESEDNESYLIPPEGVKIVYAPDTTTVIGGGSTLNYEYLSDPDYLNGIGEPYIEQNGLDSMYYVMISLDSMEKSMEKSCRQAYPEDFLNGTHTLEKHLAHKQAGINKERALLEEYGITELEFQWAFPPETDFDGYTCLGYAFVGYVKGKNLLEFEKAMWEFYWPHFYHDVEFPSNAMGGNIYLLPEGYSASEFVFGVLSRKGEDGNWEIIGY